MRRPLFVVRVRDANDGREGMEPVAWDGNVRGNLLEGARCSVPVRERPVMIGRSGVSTVAPGSGGGLSRGGISFGAMARLNVFLIEDLS